MKYRKKPVIVEAMQMPTNPDQDSVRAVALWMVNLGYEPEDLDDDMEQWDEDFVITNSDGSLTGLPEYGRNFLTIETLEGEMMARLGDYIVRGVQGEFYPCKPNIFHETYDELTEFRK